MAYRLAGNNTEFCSCDVPCPCAFAQIPTGGRCQGLFCFDVQEGYLDGLSLAGTKFILALMFANQAWTAGNLTAALILDANASQDQRDGLTRILTGQLGGDAANLAGLIGDMKGVVTAPIEYRASDGQISVRAGDVAEGAGATLKNADGSEIEVRNAHYPIPNIKAGKSTKVKVKVPGLEYDLQGSGMWTGPFVLAG